VKLGSGATQSRRLHIHQREFGQFSAHGSSFAVGECDQFAANSEDAAPIQSDSMKGPTCRKQGRDGGQGQVASTKSFTVINGLPHHPSLGGFRNLAQQLSTNSEISL